MQITLRKVEGVQAAIEAMYFSKRTWTPELSKEIERICKLATDRDGMPYKPYAFTGSDVDDIIQFGKWIDMLARMTVNHITIGKYIDLTFVVEGLHRAGQDDIDSHAKRMDNRIIRSSTRLADFQAGEMSNFYKGKIIPTDEVLKHMEIEMPEEITINGMQYVKAVNGYILKGMEEDKDVKRGLYMLSIPSNFIFKINLTEWAHVYKERNEGGTAHPEVKACVELGQKQLSQAYSAFNRDLMLAIKN